MATVVIRDRGRGPEIEGTRITVYHLLPYFLDPKASEEYIGRVHGLTADEVAAARAYVLNNPDTVLAEHLRIEARIAQGNPPHVIEQAERTRETFLRFKEWLASRERAESREHGTSAVSGPDSFPTLREWVAQADPGAVEGS
jgi:hypothetical protein